VGRPHLSLGGGLGARTEHSNGGSEGANSWTLTAWFIRVSFQVGGCIFRRGLRMGGVDYYRLWVLVCDDSIYISE
jgi:hypothetical protein